MRSATRASLTLRERLSERSAMYDKIVATRIPTDEGKKIVGQRGDLFKPRVDLDQADGGEAQHEHVGGVGKNFFGNVNIVLLLQA